MYEYQPQTFAVIFYNISTHLFHRKTLTNINNSCLNKEITGYGQKKIFSDYAC